MTFAELIPPETTPLFAGILVFTSFFTSALTEGGGAKVFSGRFVSSEKSVSIAACGFNAAVGASGITGGGFGFARSSGGG